MGRRGAKNFGGGKKWVVGVQKIWKAGGGRSPQRRPQPGRSSASSNSSYDDKQRQARQRRIAELEGQMQQLIQHARQQPEQNQQSMYGRANAATVA